MTLKTPCLSLRGFEGLCDVVVFDSSGGDLVLLSVLFHVCVFWALVLFMSHKGTAE